MWIRLIFATILLLQGSVSFGTPLNSLDEKPGPYDVELEFLEDKGLSLTVNEVRNLPPDSWHLIPGGGTNFGYTRSQIWTRFSLRNQGSEAAKYVVEVGYPQLDQVELFLFANGTLEKVLLIGDQHPFYPREIDHPNFLLRVPLAPGEIKTIYIRTQTEGAMQYPLRVWREKAFFEASAAEIKLHFYYYGLISLMILLNLAIFAMLREVTYLYYALSLLGNLLFFFCLRGFFAQHILINHTWVQHQAMLLSIPVLSLFSILFARSFLNTPQVLPKIDLALKVLAIISAVNLIGAFFLPYGISIRASALLAAPLWLVLIFAGPIAWWKGSRPAIYFTFAWSTLTTGFVVTMAHKYGILPNTFWSDYGMQIGSAIEATILTIALAERLHQEREEKVKAQMQSLKEGRERREAQMQLIQMALHDPVTRLPNRNLYEMAIYDHIKSVRDKSYLVVLMRMTRFEEITKTLGLIHAESLTRRIGKKANQLASGLTGVVPIEKTNEGGHWVSACDNDTLGFLVEAEAPAQNSDAYIKFMADMAEPFDYQGLNIEVGAVFGVSVYPKNGRDATKLIRHAHVALESARRRNPPMAFYSPRQDGYDQRRLTLMTDLRQALRDNLPILYYQPKVSLANNQVVGIEALIRWRNEDGEFVPPDHFIPLAEKTGVIRELTRWVVRRALEDFKELQMLGYVNSLSVNLSAKNLMETDLEAFLKDALERLSLPRHSLVLELTETAIMEDPGLGLSALHKLSDEGLKVSIDDFGAGYSSLSYLKQLPASEIKIDRALITDICEKETSRIIVQTTIDMCHSLGFDVVAEGVESEAVLEILTDMGCDIAQGYHLSRPMNFKSLKLWLESRQSNSKSLSA
ncbi:EAL domain-containing protein [Hahella ganghwensis]|uniref:EAL domain-containing protein n=1 Tax=Hahella ganghwensis TaxID=286420 RepID=UPI00037A9091|nr:EAL domain-containing protein [Hahella ganghwensis]